MRLLQLGDHRLGNSGSTVAGSLAHEASREARLGTVTLAGGTQTAIKMDLQAGRLRPAFGVGATSALVEVIRDAHRPDGV